MKRGHVRQILPDIASIDESVIEQHGNPLGYHCSVRMRDGSTLGSGCHPVQHVARIISLAEAMERTLFQSLVSNEALCEAFLLDEYPTSCGFALGLDASSTITRAKAEAVERWLRSKWIDDGFMMERSTMEPEHCSELARFFYSQFDDVLTFRSVNLLRSLDDLTERFFSLVVVGLKDAGAFVGSRTSISNENLEEHALIEAWRHMQISKQIERYPDTDDFRQIHYFGQNAQTALDQISLATKGPFPEPELRLLKQVETGLDDLFMFRALCKDFRGWHGPDHRRFVY